MAKQQTASAEQFPDRDVHRSRESRKLDLSDLGSTVDLPNEPLRAPTEIVHYRPLEQGAIRLVNFGAAPGEPVLAHHRLRDKPKFTAISYCWGTENCLHKFELNGQILLLTSSLFLIFTELKRRGHNGKVWADAICINQDDAGEKSEQIPLMSVIYKNAYKVLAWLSIGRQNRVLTTKHIRSIIEFTESLARRNPSWRETSKLPWRHWNSYVGFEFRDSDILPNYEHVCDELVSIAQSPYFQRVWTWQEAITSHRIYICLERLTLEWRDINTLLKALHSVGSSPHEYCARMGLVPFSTRAVTKHIPRILSIAQRRWDMKTNGHTALVKLFKRSLPKLTTRPEDKVYALYSFMDPSFQALVPVDPSASAQRVFIRTAKALLLLETNAITLISLADQEGKYADLPSWVPDFRYDISFHMLAERRGFTAGGRGRYDPPRVCLADDDDTMAVGGFELCAISEHVRTATALWEFWKTDAEDALGCIQCCIALASKADSGLGEASTYERVGRTLVADRPDIVLGRGKDFSSLSLIPQDMLRHFIEDLKDPHHNPEQAPKGLHEYIRSCRFVLHRRSFFITDSGHIGVGPLHLRDGDRIAVLFGAEVPFVVRKRVQGGNYKLVGECYVDGIMHGEAVEEHRAAGGEVQTFTFD